LLYLYFINYIFFKYIQDIPHDSTDQELDSGPSWKLHSHRYIIQGGIFHHFATLVLSSEPYERYMRVNGADCSRDTLRKNWNMETTRKMGTDYMDEHIIFRLRSHPLIWLLKMFCWNPKICCVPLGELDSFVEFFQIYSIEVSVFSLL